jgi:hypothetical protein
MSALGWSPRDGETVHLNPRNRWQLPAGRYTLHAGKQDLWALQLVSGALAVRRVVERADLVSEEARTLTPISADELERERREVQLRAHAPLRGNRRGPMLAQHDASELALFRAANEPGLGL